MRSHLGNNFIYEKQMRLRKVDVNEVNRVQNVILAKTVVQHELCMKKITFFIRFLKQIIGG